MKTDLTNLDQLRQTALAAQGLTAEVAGAAADAIGEVAAGLPVRRSATLTAAGWTGSGPYSQTVAVEGVRADEAGQLVQPVPASASRTAWRDAGVECAGQGNGSLTFTAQERPEGDIPVYVILQALGGGAALALSRSETGAREVGG